MGMQLILCTDVAAGVSPASGNLALVLRPPPPPITKCAGTSGAGNGTADSPSRQFMPTPGYVRKMMIAGVPTSVYWPVNVSAPVCRFTLNAAMASAL